MSLVIRKFGSQNFTHETAGFEPYSSSDMVFVFDGNFLKIRSENGRIIFSRDGFRYNTVTVYDVGGSAEVFTSVTALQQRLIDLGHPAYDQGGGIVPGDYVSRIVAGTNVTLDPVGGTGTVTVNSTGSGGGGELEYQAEITTSTTLTTQKGLNKVYPVDSSSDIIITVPQGVYSENDVINFERRGSGSVEFIGANDNVRLRGVRDVENRYFIDSTYSWVALVCRGSNEFSVVGRLKSGYTGAVTTSNYTALGDGDTNKNVTVTGTGFSDNMVVSVSSNATLNSVTVNSATECVLNLNAVGGVGDTVTVTYDNGDVFVDTDAITIIAVVPVGNIVSYWDFDNQVNDQVGSNNGSVTGSITYTSGLVGDAGVFTLGDEISVADDDTLSFNPNDPFSVSFWVYQTGYNNPTTNIVFLFSKRDGSGAEYQIAAQGGFFNIFLFSLNSTGDRLNLTSVGGVVLNQWQHICVTYNGSGDISGLNLYVDGVSNNTDNSIGSYSAMSNTTAPVLMAGATWSTNEFSLLGRMDETVLFNKALSADEVEAVRQKGLAGEEVNS